MDRRMSYQLFENQFFLQNFTRKCHMGILMEGSKLCPLAEAVSAGSCSRASWLKVTQDAEGH